MVKNLGRPRPSGAFIDVELLVVSAELIIRVTVTINNWWANSLGRHRE